MAREVNYKSSFTAGGDGADSAMTVERQKLKDAVEAAQNDGPLRIVASDLHVLVGRPDKPGVLMSLDEAGWLHGELRPFFAALAKEYPWDT